MNVRAMGTCPDRVVDDHSVAVLKLEVSQPVSVSQDGRTER